MNRFPCVIMRGGTSKAVCFKSEDMPENRLDWEAFLLDVMGSPDVKQIDGLGGANSLTSKVAIIGVSDEDGIDLDYTFAQVSLNQSIVDMKGNCGNISSVVAPFAVEQELIEVDKQAISKKIIIKNTNTKKIIEAEIRVENGMYVPEGNHEIPGVPGSGSKIEMVFHGAEGAVTGKLLPTENTTDIVRTSKGDVRISIVDSANPLVFIEASSIGLKGTELPSELSKEVLDYIEEIRGKSAELCGFSVASKATLESPAVPKATIVSKSKSFVDMKGRHYSEDEMDLTVRMMSMQKPHQALAITGAVCISSAAKIKGTLVYELVDSKKDGFKIAHPSGIMSTVVEMNQDRVKAVKVTRTARRIMQGDVFTHKNY